MDSYNKNIEIVVNDKADKVFKKLFRSLLIKYQNNLQKSMKCSNFIFYCFYLIHYRCHKINLKCGRSYIDSPICIKTKKATITGINKDDNKCFLNTATLVLNHKEIRKRKYRNLKLL